jgi:hypothetical protein
MNAEEIRVNCQERLGQPMQEKILAEIAAQLAEINQTLKDIQVLSANPVWISQPYPPHMAQK